jgi:hypothetical protein
MLLCNSLCFETRIISIVSFVSFLFSFLFTLINYGLFNSIIREKIVSLYIFCLIFCLIESHIAVFKNNILYMIKSSFLQ